MKADARRGRPGVNAAEEIVVRRDRRRADEAAISGTKRDPELGVVEFDPADGLQIERLHLHQALREDSLAGRGRKRFASLIVVEGPKADAHPHCLPISPSEMRGVRTIPFTDLVFWLYVLAPLLNV